MVENTHKKKTSLSPLCWPNIVVVPFVWWRRSKSGRGEGLDRAGRNRGHSEDVEQGQVLHRVPLLLPRRFVAGSSSKQIIRFERLGSGKAHCCFLVQGHGVQVWMTRRAPTFPGFSDWDGPSNSCRRLELQICLEMSKKHKMLNCTLYPLSLFFFVFLFVFLASSYRVWLGEPSGSTPAPLCQVMWWLWVIWLVQINIPI